MLTLKAENLCLPTQNVFKLYLLCHEMVMKLQPHAYWTFALKTSKSEKEETDY